MNGVWNGEEVPGEPLHLTCDDGYTPTLGITSKSVHALFRFVYVYASSPCDFYWTILFMLIKKYHQSAVICTSDDREFKNIAECIHETKSGFVSALTSE